MKSPTNRRPAKVTRAELARNRTRALLSQLDSLTRAYLVTALWSSTDTRGGEDIPLDREHGLSDLAPAAVEMAMRDCARFSSAMESTLAAAIESCEVVCGPDFDEWGRAGHDLWLTRNGHGAGFWDGDWPEPYASQLSAYARAQGSVDAYVGDDGMIHFDREDETADRAAGLHYSQTGTRRNEWHARRFEAMAGA